jgi:hypothetical protein
MVRVGRSEEFLFISLDPVHYFLLFFASAVLGLIVGFGTKSF